MVKKVNHQTLEQYGPYFFNFLMSKGTILTFVHHYLPGYKSGGPIQTISNITEALGDEFTFRIVCADRDSLDTSPYPDISVNSWCKVGKAMVHYTPPCNHSIRYWLHLLRVTPHDVVYLNSFFDQKFSLLPMLATMFRGTASKPVMIAPRGEFSPGAIAIKSWKKEPYLITARRLGLYRNILWHASTNEESHLIQQQFGKASRVSTAINLPSMSNLPLFEINEISSLETFRIIYLSRITRKKNLDFGLSVLAKTRVKLIFDIWGVPADLAFWRKCQTLIRTMPNHITVNYRGEAQHSEVFNILSKYDLLFLPTHGENYGHVIAESIACGTPVLLSDQTPWRNLKNEGVGWDLSLNDGVNTFRDAIEAAARTVGQERLIWRKKVLDFAKRKLNDPSLLKANRELFFRAIRNTTGQGTK